MSLSRVRVTAMLSCGSVEPGGDGGPKTLHNVFWWIGTPAGEPCQVALFFELRDLQAGVEYLCKVRVVAPDGDEAEFETARFVAQSGDRACSGYQDVGIRKPLAGVYEWHLLVTGSDGSETLETSAWEVRLVG